LSDYKKIGVVLKKGRIFAEYYIYIYLFVSDQMVQRTHTRKRLFFYAWKSFNMTWSATPLHMVNYCIGEKDQSHIQKANLHTMKLARKCVAIQTKTLRNSL